MQITLGAEGLLKLVIRQLDSLFNLPEDITRPLLQSIFPKALDRTEGSFRRTNYSYLQRDGAIVFNPYHSGLYCIFLYYLANTVRTECPKDDCLADALYCLNKTLNAVDLYHEIQLPSCFFLDHPVGSVMGRATYGDYFFFAQNCTVGSNRGHFPVLGEHVTMYMGSQLIGNAKVGHHVVLSANAYVKDQDIPPCTIVFGASPDLVFVSKPQSYFEAATNFYIS